MLEWIDSPAGELPYAGLVVLAIVLLAFDMRARWSR